MNYSLSICMTDRPEVLNRITSICFRRDIRVIALHGQSEGGQFNLTLEVALRSGQNIHTVIKQLEKPVTVLSVVNNTTQEVL
ncbi:ACT domain-containing protein [Macrococcoides caseolyticum]|uniref:ACT domain-containing protein n=1 Tax=Macrococcoides caseolyticum TaxID=69966 RepID=UPI00059ED840|nr:ACT domain-containing protein [Macrococcus caseolyticus]ARQ04310.1 acetolactate synthase 2 regulatory subunit [Macrococcus caseolyticus]MDJ1088560.1 ACT domain-containing protein [Macrococcus caseolyticus]PKE00175.1 hypothetical protein CW719_01370 [Macrococcus caseolyticus]PKE17850.1 hypothetical protein CW718_02350 [Macrococcus caseolyticus]PKE34716.1 hypothetical protein CW668_00510 [Macrococcus caseolyticus]